ncbi:hypothetical protein EMCRGX_G032811 [Ephydatia muelleri]
MAHIHLDPPESFNFTKPDEWSRVKTTVHMASGLTEERGEKQVSTLLNCLREQAEDILNSAGIMSESEDRKVCKEVVDTLDAFFRLHTNVIFEHSRFDLCSQQEGESAEEYITVLCSLAEDCEYKEWKEEIIRDKLGILSLQNSVCYDGAGTMIRHFQTCRPESDRPEKLKLAGAEVTTISQNSLRCLDVITLQNPLKAVYGPAGERLSVKGQFQATFCHEGHESLETVFVVNGQIPLAADSQSLTTFVTPFRRFCFNKLPFGISSAPEHFQREM